MALVRKTRVYCRLKYVGNNQMGNDGCFASVDVGYFFNPLLPFHEKDHTEFQGKRVRRPEDRASLYSCAEHGRAFDMCAVTGYCSNGRKWSAGTDIQ